MNEAYSTPPIPTAKTDMRAKRPNVSGFGRAITKKNMIKLKMELNELCIPATIPLSCSGTASWNSCEMVRSDNQRPRRDVTIPAKRRPMEM